MLFSQYTFNKAGVNPAASGTEINQKINFTFGVNRQWVGFSNAPKENFVNFSMTIRPPRSYHYWQNVGVNIDNQESGIANNSGAYFTYAFHLLLRKNLVASFGFNVGVRTYFISQTGIDRSDPLVQKGDFSSLVYPDIIPGFRLSSKKFFMDIAVRQLSTPALQDYIKHQIGGPSKLTPTIFFSYGKMIHLSDYFLLMPSMAANLPIVGIPNIDLNAMLYYDNRMGGGLGLRNINFLTAIYQLRIVQNISVGLAYSVSLNAMRYAAPNSFEVIIGMSPTGMMTKPQGRHSIARCPGLDY